MLLQSVFESGLNSLEFITYLHMEAHNVNSNYFLTFVYGLIKDIEWSCTYITSAKRPLNDLQTQTAM